MSLSENIRYYELTPRIIEQWNNLRRILLEQHKDSISILEVAPADCERFSSDFFGLLKYRFRIDEEFWYPHLIINDMISPQDFNEEHVTIKTIPTNILSSYLDYISL